MKLLLMIAALFSWVSAVQAASFFDPRAAHALVEKGEAVLVDVREVDELSSGMARGALWLPSSTIKANAPQLDEFVGALDRGKTIIVYCGSGPRAAYFVELLRNRGFKAENMGGFDDWRRKGLPVVEAPRSLSNN